MLISVSQPRSRRDGFDSWVFRDQPAGRQGTKPKALPVLSLRNDKALDQVLAKIPKYPCNFRICDDSSQGDLRRCTGECKTSSLLHLGSGRNFRRMSTPWTWQGPGVAGLITRLPHGLFPEWGKACRRQAAAALMAEWAGCEAAMIGDAYVIPRSTWRWVHRKTLQTVCRLPPRPQSLLLARLCPQAAALAPERHQLPVRIPKRPWDFTFRVTAPRSRLDAGPTQDLARPRLAFEHVHSRLQCATNSCFTCGYFLCSTRLPSAQCYVSWHALAV